MTTHLSVTRRLALALACLLLFVRVASAQVFPTVRGTPTQNRETATVSSHSVTLPSHQVGDVLIVAFSGNDTATITIDTGASGSGWTKTSTSTSGSQVGGCMVWMIATTSAEVLTMTTSIAATSSYIAYAIVDGGTPSFAVATGNSTNSNPPSLAPAGGSADYLWIVSRHADNTPVPSAAPTNFTNLTNQAALNSAGVGTSTAQYEFTGSVLDPDVFTVNTEQWVSFTAAVPYATGGGPPATTPRILLLGVGP